VQHLHAVFVLADFWFDASSLNRLNNGCGSGGGDNCSAPGSAFANICPSSGKVCTANDIEVKGELCQPDGSVPPPKSKIDRQCFWKMPALNFPSMDQPNHLQVAIATQVQHNLETGDSAEHNELVIDERVMIPELCKDPAKTINAFVYAQSKEGIGARSHAEAMRDKFSKDYNVPPLPIIGINDVSSFQLAGGPFFVPPTEKSEVVVTV